MNSSWNFLFTIVSLCFLLSNPPDIRAMDNGWPMFGQNPQHTARSQSLGPQTNVLKWTMSTAGYFSGISVASDGTVYAAGVEGVIAIATDGSVKWSLPLYCISTPALGTDGTVYMAVYVPYSSFYALYALNPDGTTKWSFNIGYDTGPSSPVIGSDGTIYFGDYNGEIVAITGTGQQKWRFQIGGQVLSSPAISIDGTIYAMARILPSSSLNGLYAINSDGTLKWHFSTGPSANAPSIGSDGTIYATEDFDRLYAVRSDGTLKWSINLEGATVSSPAIGADGTIYVGSLSHTLSAVNSDGSLKWNYTTVVPSGSTPSNPPSIGSDGTIYVQGEGTTDQNKVFAINPDGSLKWTGALHNAAVTAPVLGPQGMLYISSTDSSSNYLYAFGQKKRKGQLTSN